MEALSIKSKVKRQLGSRNYGIWWLISECKEVQDDCFLAWLTLWKIMPFIKLKTAGGGIPSELCYTWLE